MYITWRNKTFVNANRPPRKTMEEKEKDQDTEFVKEEHDPKRGYIFQKTGITKTGFWIIIAFLILIAIGLIVSGIFFGAPAKNP